jgi:hypothetical protein
MDRSDTALAPRKQANTLNAPCVPRALTQAEEGQNEHDHHNQPDQINDLVHGACYAIPCSRYGALLAEGLPEAFRDRQALPGIAGRNLARTATDFPDSNHREQVEVQFGPSLSLGGGGS